MPRRQPPDAAAPAIGLAFLILTWTTPWIHPASKRDFGWAYSLGPAYPFFTSSRWRPSPPVSGSLRVVPPTASPGERPGRVGDDAGSSRRSLASMTDGVIPCLGVQVPRLGRRPSWCSAARSSGASHRWLLAAPGISPRDPRTLPDGVAMLRLDGSARGGNSELARCSVPAGQLTGLRGSRTSSRRMRATGRRRAGQCELHVRRPPSVAVASTAARPPRRGARPRAGRARPRGITSHVTASCTPGRLAAVGELAAGIAHEINNRWPARASCERQAFGAQRQGDDPGPRRRCSRRARRSTNQLEGVDRERRSCATCAASPTPVAAGAKRPI
jgi:hypothetical protein